MHHPGKNPLVPLVCFAALFAAAAVNAGPISDPAGDFITEYTGPERGDLDVVEIEAVQSGLDFVLTGRMAAPIDTVLGGSYVWGVNRGAGTAGFGPNYAGVLFDTVIVAQSATGNVLLNLFNGMPGTMLDPGVMTIAGDTLTLRIAKSLLPSTGFDFDSYGFNLWPRAPGIAGIAGLSDFAPDNATITAAPEPAAVSLAALALAAVWLMRRRAMAALPVKER